MAKLLEYGALAPSLFRNEYYWSAGPCIVKQRRRQGAVLQEFRYRSERIKNKDGAAAELYGR